MMYVITCCMSSNPGIVVLPWVAKGITLGWFGLPLNNLVAFGGSSYYHGAANRCVDCKTRGPEVFHVIRAGDSFEGP